MSILSACRRLGLWPLLALLCVSITLTAQPVPQDQLPPVSNDPTIIHDGSEAESRMRHDMAKRANEARQAALKKDTDKLLKLANQLKDYVDKSNENVLSLDVVKKADEIEKLAHSVKEKMKGPN